MKYQHPMLGTPPSTPASVAKDDYPKETDDSLFDLSIGNNTTFDEESFISEENGNPYISPTSPCNHDFSFSLKLQNPINEKRCDVLRDCGSPYKHYELHHSALERFVLPRTSFEVRLLNRLGTGSNSYVYEATMHSPVCGSHLIAIKIPVSRGKVKYLENEALFTMMLKKYRTKNSEGLDSYPFIDAYGLYYLNRNDFALMKKNYELPCLIMRKMDCTLTRFIRERRIYARPDEIVIGKHYWWQLCGTLFHTLEVLRTLRSVHCDLKTDNIMISFLSKSGESSPVFKVGDFSSASKLEDLQGLPGTTLQFSAPELVDPTLGSNASTKTDLFSCGMILLDAATGRAPYQAYSYDQFYLVSLAAKNKVLEVLERESVNILRANPEIYHLIKMIIKDRCTLDDATSCYKRSCF